MSEDNPSIPVRQILKRKCDEPPNEECVKHAKPLMPLFLFTRPKEGRIVEDVSTAAQTTTPMTELPNEIFVSFSLHRLFINLIYFQAKIMGYVSVEDLYSLERVSKRWRDVTLKYGWPMRDTLSYEAVTKNSDLSILGTIDEKNYNEFLRWEARHKVTNGSVRFSLFLIFLIQILDQSIFISNQCKTYRSAILYSIFRYLPHASEHEKTYF